MDTKSKRGLKLPIFLMVGPVLAIMLSLFLYAVINFALSSYAPETSSNNTSEIGNIEQGASIAQDEDLFAEDDGSGVFRTISNVLLFLLGSVSVLAFLPCLIIGIILLNKRRNATGQTATVSTGIGNRNWEDVQ